MTGRPGPIALVWTAYLLAALILLTVVSGPVYLYAVGGLGLLVTIATWRSVGANRWLGWAPGWADIAVLGAIYLAVVGLFRLAFGVFTTANTLKLSPSTTCTPSASRRKRLICDSGCPCAGRPT